MASSVRSRQRVTELQLVQQTKGKRMKKLLKTIENSMAAAAFAEAGEPATAREMLKENRRILLALSGEKSDVNAFRHAVNLCKRINAALEILHVSDDKAGLLNTFKSELSENGVQYKYIQEDGCIKEQILNHTNKNKGPLMVVVESSEQLDINCRKAKKDLNEFWKNLNCPLVVVSDLAKA